MGGQVDGFVDPRFRAVRDIFEESFADGQNLGAGLTVYANTRLVVDLWGGVADSRTGRRWERGTPCPTFSCTKAVTATAALQVAAKHRVDLYAPVTRWWPEYGCAGKEATTTADLLAHRAGLPAFDRPISAAEAADPAHMAGLLAAQTPVWEPGTRHGYHAQTFGWLAGELVRRHTDSTVGDYALRYLKAGLYIGADEAVRAETARTEFPHADQMAWDDIDPIPRETADRMAAAFRDRDSLTLRATANPLGRYNDPEVLAGGWPATGLVTTSDTLARFYRTLMQGRYLHPRYRMEATAEQVRGPDEVLLSESAFALGYMLPCENFIVPPAVPAGVFGHPGAGGALAFADPNSLLSFAFIPNLRRDWMAGDRRAYNLVESVYAAL
ncbi:serine hydrolase domain-containing protein [Nocardia sp. NPDC057668]|uniref:serine hydrolase domain-containing protein n=1 Tax=Nocardia sp. NPDC057668 TaxID=3346202 RepID=UPI00366DFF47